LPAAAGYAQCSALAITADDLRATQRDLDQQESGEDESDAVPVKPRKQTRNGAEGSYHHNYALAPQAHPLRVLLLAGCRATTSVANQSSLPSSPPSVTASN
jgi:hypothetical protein